MTDVQFSEEQEYARPEAASATPLFVRLVLRTGLVQNERQAEYVLIGALVLIVGLTFFIWSSSSTVSSGGINPTDPAQVQLMKEQANQQMPPQP